MKQRILIGLLAIILLWATTVSFLYWRLSTNPRVVAINMDTNRDPLQSQQLADIEKLTFLKQYLDRYFNFDSHNFWQSQTSLAFLMTPGLGESRVREVNRLREKIQQKSLSQLGQLRLVTQTEENTFKAQVFIQTTENSQRNNLSVETLLKLQTTERTLENPWGLLVQEMTFLSSSPQESETPRQIVVRKNSPSFLTLPCAIESIENPDEKNIKIKITTLNISELQITPSSDLTTPIPVTAGCRHLEFKITLQPSNKEQTLFTSLKTSDGAPRLVEKGNGKVHKKDIYEKTIENVLGIQLDN